MATKVSADTITAISRTLGQTTHVEPTAEELIDNFRQKLQKQISDVKSGDLSSWKPAGGVAEINADVLLSRLQSRLANFERILKDVPDGFRLTPVLFTRIDSAKNDRIHNEYLGLVRHRFMQFLAEKHPDALRNLGIAERGIDRMRQGFDPVNEKGLFYEINIDHIIERSACGSWSGNRIADPDMGPEIGDKFRVNHFSNLMLLPEHVHNFKNELNNTQRTDDIPAGESRWVLMMAPECNAQYNGYVCPPQKNGHALHGIRMRPNDLNCKMSQITFAMQQTQAMIYKFRGNAIVSGMLKTFSGIAAKQGKKVAEIANDNVYVDGKKKSLRQVFNDVASRNKDIHGLAKNRLRPLIAELDLRLSDAFAAATQNLKKARGINDFEKFKKAFKGKNMAALRRDIEDLPFGEAIQLSATFRAIEKDIDRIDLARSSKPAPVKYNKYPHRPRR